MALNLPAIRRGARLLTCACALVAIAPSLARAGRVLGPATTRVLHDSLASVPACRFDDVRVEAHRAVARLCLSTAAATCFSVELGDPDANCDGAVEGPWCVRLTTVPEGIRAAVRKALRSSSDPWVRLEDAPPPAFTPGTADFFFSPMDVLFGPARGDSWLWLVTVRADILVFLLASLAILGRAIGGAARRRPRRGDLALALGLTAVAAALRFGVVEHNLSELGGIGYSRILLGYQGYLGTAQLYSLVYARTVRDLEHAILLNRIASTLTVPLVYVLCRRLAPGAFAPIATALFSLHPLHLIFSATDALPISSSLLAAASYLLLVSSVGDADAPAWARALSAVGAASGLALLTQVRYENALLLAPAVVYLFVQRRALSLRSLAPGAILFAVFISVYAVEALGAGVSHSLDQYADGLRAAAREVLGNPIFGFGPVLIGTAAATINRRSRLRLLAPFPLLAVVPLIALASTLGHHLARTYVNEVLVLSLVAGYGVALMWESPRRSVRGVAAGCLVWTGVLPVLFWPNLRERHLETAEHDFFRASLAALAPGVDRIVVPDDDVLVREADSTIGLIDKYRMIAYAAGARGIDLVGVTRFLEHPGAVDCSRGNCLFFRGVPCLGISHYRFADAECARVMATRAGAPVREEVVVAGSFLDCSIYRGEARRRLCEPVRKPQRLGLYRITD